MACGVDPEELQQTLDKLANRATKLLERAHALKEKSNNHGIEGINKLIKKIQAEQSFIKSVSCDFCYKNVLCGTQSSWKFCRPICNALSKLSFFQYRQDLQRG